LRVVRLIIRPPKSNLCFLVAARAFLLRFVALCPFIIPNPFTVVVLRLCLLRWVTGWKEEGGREAVYLASNHKRGKKCQVPSYHPSMLAVCIFPSLESNRPVLIRRGRTQRNALTRVTSFLHFEVMDLSS